MADLLIVDFLKHMRKEHLEKLDIKDLESHERLFEKLRK